jgi:hypothetical protein
MKFYPAIRWHDYAIIDRHPALLPNARDSQRFGATVDLRDKTAKSFIGIHGCIAAVF